MFTQHKKNFLEYFMKNFTKTVKAIVLFTSILLLAGCSKNDRTLYLYNWTYYTPDEVISKFEQEFNCKVKVDSYSTCDEMYAKLRAGAKGYDIVIPSNDFVSIMIKQGMLQKIDQTKLTNRDKISPQVLTMIDFDSNMEYCVPYAFSATGIIVNKTKVTNPNYSRSYDIFSDPQFAGHATMMDEQREVLGCALASLGYDLNTTNEKELDEATQKILKEWKPNLVKFDAEGFGKSFASGDFWLCQGYPEICFGEVDKTRWEDTIDFFIPEEGGPATMDCMVILKDAPHAELANEFINFIHRPENYAIFIDQFGYPCIVNPEALNYVTQKSMYDPAQALNCTLKKDLGQDLDKYHSRWQKIRFAD